VVVVYDGWCCANQEVKMRDGEVSEMDEGMARCGSDAGEKQKDLTLGDKDARLASGWLVVGGKHTKMPRQNAPPLAAAVALCLVAHVAPSGG